MAYKNKMGGVKVDYLHADGKRFWDWCERRKLWIFAEYIPSKQNRETASLSRISNRDIEWKLSGYACRKIVRIFGKPEIGLFA